MKLIANMGLFWNRDDVYWGTVGGGVAADPGKLLGKLSTNLRGPATDFWNQVGIYALYAGFDLVYVGQAGRGMTSKLGDRLRNHKTDYLSERWDRFSWFGLRFVRAGDHALADMPETRQATTPDLLDILEGNLIAVAEPPLNGQDGRFGEDVERYLQERDPRCGLTTEVLIREIHARLPAQQTPV